MDQEQHEKSKDFVQSLDRGLAIMKVFNERTPRLTLSEVAELTGFTRATARRFLLTLESLNYVGSTGRYFFLRPRVLELGHAYLSSYNLVSIAQDHLESIANELRESCSASVLENENIIYICRAASNRIMTVNIALGHQLPAYATSMGRVLLGALPEKELEFYLQTSKREKLTSRTVYEIDELRKIIMKVRKQGWAINEQELEEGVQSVAVPIHGKGNKVIAAINVSAHASRVPVERLVNEFLPKLQACAKEIEQDLSIQS
jgi:IclR family pca regulon transcriptional regulator